MDNRQWEIYHSEHRKGKNVKLLQFEKYMYDEFLSLNEPRFHVFIEFN